ncbi:MAG: 2-C-methyl-D-erythritol 2,4-cyclodiphosphate synthase [Clostridia bacterium]|nr:2-C-methyl-D-erythritol 2,4-cyclodiphosphate synthase [Clostridia bacterium]
MSTIGILLCGGSSQRMGFDKLTTPLGGHTAIERGIEAMSELDRLVIAITPAARSLVEGLSIPVPYTLCEGGATRAESVKNALLAARGEPGDVVLIHDAARCLQPAAVFAAAAKSAREKGSGVAALDMTDSVFQKDGTAPLDRTRLLLTQTPQAFRFGEILRAYEAAGDSLTATDDAALYAKFIGPVAFVAGSHLGRKLTSPADWDWAKALLSIPRTGTGFDTHVLGAGRKLILGGVEIPFEKGLVAHSDGDVLLHALMDALLGAASLGDIGHLFPDKDPQYENISSRTLLREVGRRLREKGFTVQHVDVTVLCQQPKLAPYFPEARKNIAADLQLSLEQVSLKATTTEGMNDEGRGLCISAQAIATIY